jgi:hypothetical protein
MKVTVEINGKRVEGETIGFKTVVEPWAEYILDDGSLIRFRSVATSFVKTDEKTPDGRPIYLINSQNMLDVDAKD